MWSLFSDTMKAGAKFLFSFNCVTLGSTDAACRLKGSSEHAGKREDKHAQSVCR